MHEVAVGQVFEWLTQRAASFDFKLLAGLQLVQQASDSSDA